MQAVRTDWANSRGQRPGADPGRERTGKDIIARMHSRHSRGGTGPWVKVNCPGHPRDFA